MTFSTANNTMKQIATNYEDIYTKKLNGKNKSRKAYVIVKIFYLLVFNFLYLLHTYVPKLVLYL